LVSKIGPATGVTPLAEVTPEVTPINTLKLKKNCGNTFIEAFGVHCCGLCGQNEVHCSACVLPSFCPVRELS